MRRLPEAHLKPLLWAIAAFVGGTLLNVDRVPLWAGAAAAICLTWRMAAAFGLLGMPVKSARWALAVVLVVAVYSQFRTLNGLTAGTALLVVMGSIKLLETRERRDRAILIGVSLVLLLAACLDRQNLIRAPLYLAQAWLCITAFAMTSHDGKGLTNRSAMVLAARNLLLAAPLSFMLFTLFPRITGSFWALPQLSQAVTGLGDTMSPGSISSLKRYRFVATCRRWTVVRSVMACFGQVGKKSSTARRLLPTRVGSVSSCSGGSPARLTHSVV